MFLKWPALFSLVILVAGAHAQVETAAQKIPEKLLHDSLTFFNTVLRDPVSGQYCDAISLDPENGKPCNDPSINFGFQTERNSSVAATGMGIIALALSDQIGIAPQAYDEIIKSLRFLTGEGKIGDKPYVTVKSNLGWYRHWFDLRNGENNTYSENDGFSTIDTAIVAAAAQMAANYFESTGRDQSGLLRKLADKLLLEVDWASAVADVNKGSLYLHYNLKTGEPYPDTTTTFNEYIVVACVGREAEIKRGVDGKMTEFWNKHYKDGANLPKVEYDGTTLFTDYPGNFISSFASQFAMYLCANANKKETYLNNFRNTQKADRAWFQKYKPHSHFWGLGAGEVRYKDSQNPNNIHHDYHADAIENNPHLMVSPHIIAGFLPVYPQGIEDLTWMAQNKTCSYSYRGLELLWRCNLQEPELSIDRLQAVDFSTMFMGLSTIHPKVGLHWFQQYASTGEVPYAKAVIAPRDEL